MENMIKLMSFVGIIIIGMFVGLVLIPPSVAPMLLGGVLGGLFWALWKCRGIWMDPFEGGE